MGQLRHMAEERVQRRLAAIVSADVVGYSRLIEQDEAGTLATLKDRRRTILVPLVAHHDGRIVKVMGDGVLVEFGSAVNAVACAVELQNRMDGANDRLPEKRHVVLRVGINLGDVIVDGGDLYGDGVNVAARLQSMARPGDICVYRVRSPAPGGHEYRGRADSELLPLPAKPSIAVLPFTNMSNDPEQETFVDGLTEDLITDLSRDTGLFVIARNSTFAYKGRTADVRHTARDLGVRYLVEGSARRAAGRVRINAQLIDAVGGDHLWAERFDRSLEDIFAVQDEVTGKIVEALVGRLTTTTARNRPANIEAYELCVQARGLTLQTAVAAREAILLLEHAILLDPDYAEAHRWLAFNLWFGWAFWNKFREPNRARAMAEAQRAVALDPNDAGNRWVLGIILGHERRWAESDVEFDATFKLDPNHADAWAMRSDLLTFSGNASEAIDHVRRALRLNPHPPGWYYWMLGQALYVLRDYASAVQTLRRPETHRTTSRRTLAASLAQLGRLEDARQEGQFFMMSNPHFTIGQWADLQPLRDDKTRQHFVDGYRKAGLPD